MGSLRLLLDATIVCPVCSESSRLTMPTDACRWIYGCDACGRGRARSTATAACSALTRIRSARPSRRASHNARAGQRRPTRRATQAPAPTTAARASAIRFVWTQVRQLTRSCHQRPRGPHLPCPRDQAGMRLLRVLRPQTPQGLGGPLPGRPQGDRRAAHRNILPAVRRSRVRLQARRRRDVRVHF